MSDEFYWIAVATVTVLSAARITRLFVADKFPPTYWLRHKYAEVLDRTDRSRKWAVLLFCGYCTSFWVTAAVIGLGYWADTYSHDRSGLGFLIWWLVNGAFGGSYAAAIVMAHDGDINDEDDD